jgi:RNA polymerase sigma factor (TIGR02999 family)
MDSAGPLDLTRLLQRAMDGDEQASEAVMAITYRELHALARARLRSAERITLLDTTSLVHEWYVRFSGVSGLKLENRAHFMRYASRVMRSVIVDHVRRRHAGRRGSAEPRVSLSEDGAEVPADSGGEEILRVHDALDDLERLDTRLARVVELRYFGGLTEPEIGLVLGLTERTVRRDWEKARLWLAQAMSEA